MSEHCVEMLGKLLLFGGARSGKKQTRSTGVIAVMVSSTRSEYKIVFSNGVCQVNRVGFTSQTTRLISAMKMSQPHRPPSPHATIGPYVTSAILFVTGETPQLRM